MKCKTPVDNIQNAMLYRITKFGVYAIDNGEKNFALIETLNTLSTKSFFPQNDIVDKYIR